MRIGEVAEQTGLSISNIRFYEKKGLIEPGREGENQYRDYTKEDVKRLKEIIFYRKMDLPIEVIVSLNNQEMSLQDAIKQQLADLKERQKQLQGTIDLCEKVIADQKYEDIDVDGYLAYVKEEEKNGVKFVQIEEWLSDFAEFTNVNQMIGDPYMGRLFSDFRFRSGITVLWIVLLIMIPIIEIVDNYLNENGARPFYLLFWMCWICSLIISFCQYRRHKKCAN